MPAANRRTYRRLEVNFPVRCTSEGDHSTISWQAVSRNVSSGGIYFESNMTQLKIGQTVSVEMIIPPGPGYFPYESKMITRSEVVRLEALADEGRGDPAQKKIGVAARFIAQLRVRL